MIIPTDFHIFRRGSNYQSDRIHMILDRLHFKASFCPKRSGKYGARVHCLHSYNRWAADHRCVWHIFWMHQRLQPASCNQWGSDQPLVLGLNFHIRKGWREITIRPVSSRFKIRQIFNVFVLFACSLPFPDSHGLDIF